MQEALPKHLKELALKFLKAKEKGREATNEAGRVKTELRNGVKEFWIQNDLPIGSYIRVAGTEFRYEANTTKSLDNDAILAMYDKKKITREQMLRLFNVDKGEANKILGADVVADLEITAVGDKIDIRLEDLPVEHANDEFVMAKRKVRAKIKRSVFGQEVAEREAKKVAAANPPAPAGKRRIKIKRT